MSVKILVADDSATIQKVVKITLAEEPFELLEAQNEETLFSILRSGEVNLILLDFNLSENKSGYQLAEEITKKYPKTSVLAMLGTFDSVDTNQLTKCGVKDKIVKPFDSQKFVDKCHVLIEEMKPENIIEQVAVVEEQEVELEAPPEGEEVEFEAPPEEEENVDFQESLEDEILEATEDDGKDWVVESAAPIEEEKEVEKQSIPVEEMLLEVQENKLEEVANDWVGEVPSIIGTQGEGIRPPVIEEQDQLEEGAAVLDEIYEEDEESSFDLDSTSTFRLEDIKGKEEQKTPDEEDLEYPDTIQMYKPQEKEMSGPSSKLISIDELSLDENDEGEDSTDPAIELSPNLELEEEVAKDSAPDELWAVDEEIEEEETPQEEEHEMAEVDYDKLVTHLKDQLGPFIENIIKDICTQNVEKVAWEVIPDLAENLIKKELKNISSTLE